MFNKCSLARRLLLNVENFISILRAELHTTLGLNVVTLVCLPYTDSAEYCGNRL